MSDTATPVADRLAESMNQRFDALEYDVKNAVRDLEKKNALLSLKADEAKARITGALAALGHHPEADTDIAAEITLLRRQNRDLRSDLSRERKKLIAVEDSILPSLLAAEEALDVLRVSHENQGDHYDGYATRTLPKVRSAIAALNEQI